MNVVDSSGWIEYLRGGPNADFFAPQIENPGRLVVPTISVYEVFKHLRAGYGDDDALEAIVVMQQGLLAPLELDMALEAARVSSEHRLPMADSIILATAKKYDAVLWTQDADFEGMEGVQFRAVA